MSISIILLLSPESSLNLLCKVLCTATISLKLGTKSYLLNLDTHV
nr:MAG TPA: hypothetical protein [Bacteriophage sp.]